MSILSTKQLTKQYGTEPNIVKALDGVSISIEPGEFVAIIGTSGSGKSTLLNMLGGLDRPTSGSVRVDNYELGKLKDEDLTVFRRQRIGFIFQNYNLVPVLNVYENIVMPIQLDGKKPDQKFIKEIVALLGLEKKLYNMPNTLSGGQQQRVAIARAIAVRPRVLLLDEPLSALDAQIRHNMVEEIARLHRELPELTILYVTHDQTEALTLADKIGIMKDGSLIAHGETHELYHYPPNRFSAEFLGRANILQATALKDSPEPGLVSVSCGGGLINAFSRGGLHGNNKLLCIRPQHMSLAPRSATSNRLNATLTSVHWQGDLTHLLCDVAGEAVRIVMTHVNPLPRAGDKLALYFEPGDAVLIEVQ